MAGTPGLGMSQHPGIAANQQLMDYMDQFNTAQYAAIPGYSGAPNTQGLLAPPAAQQSVPTSMQSQWDSINGRLIGDQYLPPDVSTVDLGKGWYEVHHGGQRVGTLQPGGRNGRFVNDTNWQMPQPGLVGAPPVAQPGAGAIPQAQAFSASGPYGRQAMQMAGLLGQPTPPPGGGLLGGPKRAFMGPGGK